MPPRKTIKTSAETDSSNSCKIRCSYGILFLHRRVEKTTMRNRFGTWKSQRSHTLVNRRTSFRKPQPQQEKTFVKKLKKLLAARAIDLLERESLRVRLYAQWQERWKRDDGDPAVVDKHTGKRMKPGTGWHHWLRRLQDAITPNAAHGRRNSNRRVGGLSLTRIATMQEFRRKVQVAFFTRLQPDGSKCEIREEFGQRALNSIERLRENRVKQLASRIVEAALGIGSENRKRDWEGGTKAPSRTS